MTVKTVTIDEFQENWKEAVKEDLKVPPPEVMPPIKIFATRLKEHATPSKQEEIDTWFKKHITDWDLKK